METTEREMGFRPRPEHELLLKAILLKGEESAQAWRRWQTEVGLGNIDHAAQRLIPMIHRKFKNGELVQADAEICKGVYLHTWYNNQNFLHQLRPVIAALHSRGVPVAPIKGLALTLFYLRDPGIRPMSDFDIIVPFAHREQAISVVESFGWKAGFLAPHGQAFLKDHFECDLHWHLLQEHCETDADDDFWKAAAPTAVQGMNVYRLDPADLLLHVCVHGAWWNPTPPIRWIVDATVIIEKEQDLNWARLVDQTRKREMALPMLQSLIYIKREFKANIPDHVVGNLNQIRVGARERYAFRVKTTPSAERSIVGALWFCLQEYKQMVASDNSMANPVGFLRFLKQRWRMDSYWKLPVRSIQELLRRT